MRIWVYYSHGYFYAFSFFYSFSYTVYNIILHVLKVYVNNTTQYNILPFALCKKVPFLTFIYVVMHPDLMHSFGHHTIFHFMSIPQITYPFYH